MLSPYSSFAADTGVKFGCIGIKFGCIDTTVRLNGPVKAPRLRNKWELGEFWPSLNRLVEKAQGCMSDVGSKPLWKTRAPRIPSVGSPDGFYEAALSEAARRRIASSTREWRGLRP